MHATKASYIIQKDCFWQTLRSSKHAQSKNRMGDKMGNNTGRTNMAERIIRLWLSETEMIACGECQSLMHSNRILTHFMDVKLCATGWQCGCLDGCASQCSCGSLSDMLSTAWCRNDPSAYLCVNEVKSG